MMLVNKNSIIRIIPKQILCLLLCAIGAFCLFGCGVQFKLPKFSEMPVENGFIYLEQNGGITIMGIKAEAVDEDGAVIIPKTLNGKTVKRIGYTQKNFIYAETQGGFHTDDGLDIREVYVPSTVTEIICNPLSYNESAESVKLFLNFNKEYSYKGSHLYANESYENPSYNLRYVYPMDLFEAYEDNEALKDFLFHYGYNTEGRRIANVYFNANPNEDYEFHYWIDYIEGESKLRKPKIDPTRKGYKFTGWYTEPECTNLWDFDSTIELTKMEPEDDSTQFVDYVDYIFNLENSTITLYAGWEKV